MKKKVVALVSGGMDSVAALYEANHQYTVVGALSFDYGSKHNHKEIPFAASHCQGLGILHRVIQLDFVGQLFKSDLLKSGGTIPDGHYEEQSMKRFSGVINSKFSPRGRASRGFLVLSPVNSPMVNPG